MEYIGPFAFNGIRFILGSLSLFPLIAIRSKYFKNNRQNNTYFYAFAAGTCCFIAVTFQQLGIIFTTAGNAGFITGLYVVLTPIMGILLGRKTGKATWIGTIFTLTGLYLISAAGHMDRINPGDILIAIGAVFWAVHVLLIDSFVKKTDPIILSSGQFLVCGIYSLIAAFLIEPFMADWLNKIQYQTNVSGLIEWSPMPHLVHGLFSGTVPLDFISGAAVPVLFGGLASVGIAYTLQVVAQKNAPPAHATIILCLEGCFAVLGGIIVLNESPGTWTVPGFALMLTGMLISQWEVIAGPQRQEHILKNSN